MWEQMHRLDQSAEGGARSQANLTTGLTDFEAELLTLNPQQTRFLVIVRVRAVE